MPYDAFDTLRARHSDWIALIAGLRASLSDILSHDPHAVIDGDIVAKALHEDRTKVNTLLLELASHSVLAKTYFWLCANGRGTAEEADSIEEFPDIISCDRCGEPHFFSHEYIEVHFLPTDTLMTALSLPHDRAR